MELASGVSMVRGYFSDCLEEYMADPMKPSINTGGAIFQQVRLRAQAQPDYPIVADNDALHLGIKHGRSWNWVTATTDRFVDLFAGSGSMKVRFK